jgi:hypothetical protein
MALALGVTALVCVAGLVAWRWYLEQRKWELSQKAAARDEALAEFGPRMTALERRIADAAYTKAFK